MAVRFQTIQELILLVFLLVLLAIIAAKLDGNISASWFVTLTPLWLLDAFYVCLLLYALGEAIRQQSLKEVSLMLAFLLGFSSFVTFQLLLIFVAEGVLQIPFVVVAAPLGVVAIELAALQVYKFVKDKKKEYRVRRRR